MVLLGDIIEFLIDKSLIVLNFAAAAAAAAAAATADKLDMMGLPSDVLYGRVRTLLAMVST